MGSREPEPEPEPDTAGEARRSLVAQALRVTLADQLSVSPDAVGEIDPETAATVLHGLRDYARPPSEPPPALPDAGNVLGQDAVAACIRLRLALELDMAPERLANLNLVTAALMLDRLSGRRRFLAESAEPAAPEAEPAQARSDPVEHALRQQLAEQLAAPPDIVRDVPAEVASLLLLRLVPLARQVRQLSAPAGESEAPAPPAHERRDMIARIMRNTIASDVNVHPRLVGELSPVAAAVVLAKFAEDQRGLIAVRAQLASDELTGALRRAAGQEALEREIRRARRLGGGALVLAFADVDSLKDVNDSEGHAGGDELLKALVHRLRRRLRAYDVVARWGGDEFICVLPQTDLAAAEAILQHVQKEFAEGTGGRGFTVGFAALAEDDTAETLLARADADLYQRKARRRGGAEAPPPKKEVETAAEPRPVLDGEVVEQPPAGLSAALRRLLGR